MTDTKFEDPFSQEVWETTYKDYKDETVDDTMRRVAKFVASAEETPEKREEWEEIFYEMLSGFKCTAGGRIYSNAGTESKGTTLFNCFTSPRQGESFDSIEGIIQNLRNQSLTLKSEGGWGENFSILRPRGSFIYGIFNESPGSVKFMELFDKASDIITSGSGKKSINKKSKGKIRKGAMLAIIDSWHPDVIEFITAKQQPGRLTKFNVSVNCTDAFMQAVMNNEDWTLQFPDTTYEKYNKEWNGDLQGWKEKGYPVVDYQTVSAQWLWNLIMESTYARAEPGVLFLDRANYFYPASYHARVISGNPCSEQLMPEGSTCNLGSLNLTQFLNDTHNSFDFNKIKKYVRYIIRFLDNINTVSKLPLEEYEDNTRNMRRIGLGVLGWGSSLFMMKVRFGSEKAQELQENLMRTITTEAYKASIDIAEEKGMFKYCDPQKHAESPFVKLIELPDEYMEKLKRSGIRNSSILSCQPTGNSSILANVVSGGIEPVFMPEYIRTVIINNMPEHIADRTPKWYEGEWHETEMFKFTKEGDEEILKGIGPDGITYKIDKNRGLTKEVLCQDYGVRWLQRRDEWNPKAEWAVTTENLSVEDHVNDLTGFAKWIDSSISKTVNVPYDYPFEDFKNIYLDAYKTGYIKGITTYRAGTMTSVLSVKEEKELGSEYEEEIILEDVKIPPQSPAVINTIKSEGRKWYLTTIMDEKHNRPIAFFVHTNHHEKTVTTQDAVERLIKLAKDKGIPARWIYDTILKAEKDNNATKIARMISLNLRHGVLIKNVVTVLDHVEDVFVGSFLFQIKKYLSTFIRDGEKVENEKCLECGSETIVYREGCKLCLSCSSSKCG